MNEYKRAKLNKILIIVASVLVVIAIIVVVLYGMIRGKNKKKDLGYADTIINKNYYVDITIDTETKNIKRDNIETTLQKEFEISDEQAEVLLNSTGDLINYFENSTIEVEMQNKIIHLKNPYQT